MGADVSRQESRETTCDPPYYPPTVTEEGKRVRSWNLSDTDREKTLSSVS